MLSTEKDFLPKLQSLRYYLQETTVQLYRSIESLESKVRQKDAYGEEMVREDVGEIIDRLDIALDDLHEHVVVAEDDIDLDDDVTCCASGSCECKDDAPTDVVDAAASPAPAVGSPTERGWGEISESEAVALMTEINSFNDELTSKLLKQSADDIEARIFAELILGAVGL